MHAEYIVVIVVKIHHESSSHNRNHRPPQSGSMLMPSLIRPSPPILLHLPCRCLHAALVPHFAGGCARAARTRLSIMLRSLARQRYLVLLCPSGRPMVRRHAMKSISMLIVFSRYSTGLTSKFRHPAAHRRWWVVPQALSILGGGGPGIVDCVGRQPFCRSRQALEPISFTSRNGKTSSRSVCLPILSDIVLLPMLPEVIRRGAFRRAFS